MWQSIKALSTNSKLILGGAIAFILISGATTVATQSANNNLPICDGTSVTKNCKDESGTKYSKYIYHEAVEEVKKEVEHPAEPAETHKVHHDAVYRTVQKQECIKANMGKYAGNCALSQCADGAYSGSTGSGTCSHHGGVAARGPFYTTVEVRELVSPAYDEEVIDVPAKEAYTETVVVTPAKEAYYEKVEM